MTNDLIIEISGTPQPIIQASETASLFINGEHKGAVIIAEHDNELIGVRMRHKFQ